MRDAFANMILTQYNRDDCYFLSGDLGFMALENVQKAFGHRFVNAGVAEQNMVSVAAGLAREGNRVFVYSIAPFVYARPFEQIRNDVCMSKVPVCLVGNGGGYAYGYMGPTHHALEDCAAMNALSLKVLVPAFDDDLPDLMQDLSSPTYLRLGYDARPKGSEVPKYAPWRQVLTGESGAIAALGPLAGVAWQALIDIPAAQRPSVWAVTEFNEDAIPEEFWNQIDNNRMYVIEEHVAHVGLGMHVALVMVRKGIQAQQFVHRYAKGYLSGRFGSQNFHRAECGLDINGIRALVLESKE